jgi:hypothetical protein
MKRPGLVAGFVTALLCSACGDSASLFEPTAVRTNAPETGLATHVASGAGAGLSFAPATPARPFKGRFEGTQAVTPLTPPLASVEVSASGNATELGRFTIELPHTVNFATRTAQGTATLVAANGDMLIADFTGQAEVGPIVSIVEHATITAGTGRFAGATGSFTIERVFDPAAGTTSGSFQGIISIPAGGW